MGDDWVDVKTTGVSGVITDIVIVSKREKAGEYNLIENTYDGKRANFAEGGLFDKTTRYVGYSRKTGKRGFVVVTDLKVHPSGDRPPLGYMPLAMTMDDNSKCFHSKQLLAKFTPQGEASNAITDLIVLSVNKKEEVPSGYKRLPEINGFSICFKVGPVPNRSDPKATQQPAPSTQQNQADTFARMSTIGGKKLRSAVDGLQFRLNHDNDMEEHIVKYAPGDLHLLTLQDIEDKYDHDFDRWNDLLSSSS